MEELKRTGLATIILAAGKGTRMKSDLVKILHPLCGKPMVWYVAELARTLRVQKIVIVVGHQASKVRETMGKEDLIYALQEEQLGSAHAVLQAAGALEGFAGDILILCGDVPLLRPATIEGLLTNHRAHGGVITVMTAVLDDPGSYGRVVKNETGDVLKIVETRDANSKEKMIREINTGIYCARSDFLFEAVRTIGNTNNQGEYYFTDIFEIARNRGWKTGSFIIPDPTEAMGINTAGDLAAAEKRMRDRLSRQQ